METMKGIFYLISGIIIFIFLFFLVIKSIKILNLFLALSFIITIFGIFYGIIMSNNKERG